MSNVIVPLEHQSSPKETQIDKEIRLATEEIVEGKFVPLEPEDGWNTGTEGLAQHPRVMEALAKLETQIQERTSSEYLEFAQMYHELNWAAQEAKRWPGQRRWEGPEVEAMRLVNEMTVFQFIDKLEAAGIRAAKAPTVSNEYRADENGVMRLAEVESSNSLICLGHRVYQSCCGLFAHVSQGDGTTAYTHIATLQVPVMPEWDLLRFDEWGVPVNHRYRGWRTAVLALVHNRVITEDQAVQAFGKPIENEASSFYRQQLYEFRNGGSR